MSALKSARQSNCVLWCVAGLLNATLLLHGFDPREPIFLAFPAVGIVASACGLYLAAWIYRKTP